MSRGVRHVLEVTLLPLLLLFLAGCPFESDIPLSLPGDAAVDRELIGTWRPAGKEDGGAGTVTVSRFNDHELLILVEEKGGAPCEMLRAFTTHVGKERFLNIQGMDRPYDQRKWMYLNYSVRGGTLTYRIVNDTLLKERAAEISSSRDLAQLVQELLTDKDLFDSDQTTLVRKP